ncbi:Fic family protein [Patescibacteria group bacterium]|nr:Fic family protein [Patescibacteria group bacterium]MBU4141265.1 Fic family protein [Patescibacteria group bacterium]
MIKQEFLDKIKANKKILDAKRSLTQSEIKTIRKWFDVTYTYHTNAIEGNTLTLSETRMILEDGLTVGGKQVKEILEAKNHQKTLDLLFEIVSGEKDLSEEIICNLHKKLLLDIDDENAGNYRKIQVYITGSEDLPPTAKEVSGLMKEFIKWYSDNKIKIDLLELVALIHHKFVKIHPFIDGNGRIARLLVNLILSKNGYPPIIIPIIRRQEYIEAIKKGEESFALFMLDIINVNLEDYLRMTEE